MLTCVCDMKYKSANWNNTIRILFSHINLRNILYKPFPKPITKIFLISNLDVSCFFYFYFLFWSDKNINEWFIVTFPKFGIWYNIDKKKKKVFKLNPTSCTVQCTLHVVSSNWTICYIQQTTYVISITYLLLQYFLPSNHLQTIYHSQNTM